MAKDEMNPTALEGEEPRMEGEGEEGGAKPGGAPGQASVTVKKGDVVVVKHDITKLPVLIGRKSTNDIVLEDRNVSRSHARIVQKEEGYFLEDAGSAGGTLVNGEKVTEKDIHTGDVIQIGGYTLQFDSGIPEDERTVLEAEDKTVLEEGTVTDEDRTVYYEEAQAKLIVVKAEGLEGPIPVQDGMVFGREEGADIVVDDKRLSRKHCSIALQDNHFLIKDLGSANGTFVNGQKITEAVLKDRDKIQIGSSVFEFRMEKAAAPSRRGGAKVLGIAALSLALLAAAAYLVYRFVIVPMGNKPHEFMVQKVWEHAVPAAVEGSPALGDLNGDGFIDMVVPDISGAVFALDGRQGGLIWNSEYKTGGPIQNACLLVDINEKDGTLDVLVPTETKGLLAIDGGTMRTIWRGNTAGPASSPAAADINEDGTPDVFVGTKSGSVICFDGRQGGIVWSFDTKSSVDAAPVLSDVNGDGVPDVIVGAGNNRVYSLNGRNGETIWVYADTETPSTAACADFNRDRTADVAVLFPKKLVVLEGKSNAVLFSWPVPQSAWPGPGDPFLPSPPAIADLNGDGNPDVVFSTPGGHLFAVDGSASGTRYLWDYGVTPSRKTSPALCDMNGDRIPDVIAGDADGNVIVIDGKMGHRLNQLNVGSGIAATPVAGDFTGDGKIDIAVGTKDGRVVALETQSRITKNKIVWGSFGGNARNTGVLTESVR